MAACPPEANFVKELLEKFKCSICTNILDTPVLTECCGQHFCEACLEKWLKGKSVGTCPHCRAKNFNRIVSQPILREINELEVYCSNRNNGCKEIITYGALAKHVINCPQGIVECTNKCGKILLRKDLEEHCKQKCSHRIVHCELCNTRGMFRVITGPHTTTCPNMSVECPNNCGKKVKQKEIFEHQKICPLEIVECPFHKVGCDKRLRRKELEEHDATEIRSHLQLTMINTTSMAREHKKLQSGA